MNASVCPVSRHYFDEKADTPCGEGGTPQGISKPPPDDWWGLVFSLSARRLGQQQYLVAVRQLMVEFDPAAVHRDQRHRSGGQA